MGGEGNVAFKATRPSAYMVMVIWGVAAQSGKFRNSGTLLSCIMRMVLNSKYSLFIFYKHNEKKVKKVIGYYSHLQNSNIVDLFGWGQGGRLGG